MPVNPEDFIKRAIEGGKTREEAVRFLQSKGISPDVAPPDVTNQPPQNADIAPPSVPVLGPPAPINGAAQGPPVLPPRLSDIDDATPFDAEVFRTEAIKQGKSPESIDAFLETQGVINRKSFSEATRGGVTGIATQFGKNILSSGAGAIGDVASVVRHPVQTVKSIGGLGAGLVQKVIPGEQAQEKNVDALVQFFGERYGSPEALGRTAFEDPVGFALDIASLVSGAGAAVGGVGKVSKVGKITQAGKIISKTGKVLDFADPGVLAVKAVGSGVKQIGKFGAPFKDFVDPRVTAIAEKLGLKDLPASARNTNRAISLAEARAVNRGEVEITRRVDKSAQDLSKAADDVVNRIGGDRTPLGAGRKVVEGLENFDRQTDKAIREAFSAIGDTSQIPADFKQTLAKLNEIEARTSVSKITDPNVANLRAILEDVLSEDAGAITLQMVDQTRTVFRRIKNRGRGQFLKGGTVQPDLPVDAAYAGEIYDAMTDDLFNAAEAADPKLADQIRKAKTVYAQAKERINSDIAKKIVNLRDEPDKIVDTLINRQMSELTPARVFELIGEEATKDVQTAFVSRLFDKAKTADGAWRPLALKTQLNSFTDPKLLAVLPPDIVESLKEIADVSAAFQRLKRLEGSTPTGFFIEQMARESEFADAIATVGGFLGGSFDVRGVLLTLTQIVGRQGVAKFIASNAGQRFLTEGTIGGRAIIGIGEAISRTAPVTGRVARQTQRLGTSQTLTEPPQRRNRQQ